MTSLHFDKGELHDSSYSLVREMLLTNRRGGYLSTTIPCCNTRKYHGLMVLPLPQFADENYVLVSSVDETLVTPEGIVELAMHRFAGVIRPDGGKYIADFAYSPTPKITYRIRDRYLTKEMLFLHARSQVMIRYTLSAGEGVILRLRPFFAFRSIHTVTHANLFADGRSYAVKGGVRTKLYEGFPWVYMQLNTTAEFVPAPDWWYGFQYEHEQQRGYDYNEDLMTTGYFELHLTPGDSFVVTLSLEENFTCDFDDRFTRETALRRQKLDFISCLRHSARQFLARRGGYSEVVAGYPWFGRWGRDTFIALPGITLTQGLVAECRHVLDSMVRQMRGPLFPNMGNAYNSVDAPLWFFFTLQRFEEYTDAREIWNSYGTVMKRILEGYRSGISSKTSLAVDALIYAEQPALSWMDAVVDKQAVTPRVGMQVEVNALWYNAVCYALKLAEKFGDGEFVSSWMMWPQKIREAFQATFWLPKAGYLCDYVSRTERNTFVRANMVLAASLPYVPLENEQIKSMLSVIEEKLLTPKGLRTLSPDNPEYVPRYEGTPAQRDRAYHNGSVWVWPLEHYVRAKYRLLKGRFTRQAERLVAAFHEDIDTYGLASLPELYDGEPPYNQRGAISQAWSVGAVLAIHDLVEKHRVK